MKIAEKVKKELSYHFMKNMKKIFKNNLVFAFICGSVARNNISRNSDIDILICVQKKDEVALKKFNLLYKQLHKQYNLCIDKLYPGEIITLNRLNSKLKDMSLTVPSINIRKPNIFDGLIWAGMLSGKYTAFIGNKTIFFQKRKISKNIARTWSKKLLDNYQKLPADLALKKLIKFNK